MATTEGTWSYLSVDQLLKCWVIILVMNCRITALNRLVETHFPAVPVFLAQEVAEVFLAQEVAEVKHDCLDLYYESKCNVSVYC